METITEFIQNRNYDIDKQYIDVVWDLLVQKKWVYLSSEIIQVVGFQDEQCFEIMKRKLKAGSEYEEIDSIDQIVPHQEDNNHKYYLISPKAFKRFLSLIDTDGSRKLYDCYISLEEAVLDYAQYKCNFLSQKIDNSIDGTIVNPLNKDGFIYVATTDKYRLNNTFKIGQTTNMVNRLRQYNVGRRKDDRYYYIWWRECANSKGLEKWILGFLIGLKDSKNTEVIISKENDLMEIINFLYETHNQTTDKLTGSTKQSTTKFSLGQKVYTEDHRKKRQSKWEIGQIMRSTSPTSYEVQITSGRVWKRHVDQIRHIDEPISEKSNEESDQDNELIEILSETQEDQQVPSDPFLAHRYPRRNRKPPDRFVIG